MTPSEPTILTPEQVDRLTEIADRQEHVTPYWVTLLCASHEALRARAEQAERERDWYKAQEDAASAEIARLTAAWQKAEQARAASAEWRRDAVSEVFRHLASYGGTDLSAPAPAQTPDGGTSEEPTK